MYGAVNVIKKLCMYGENDSTKNNNIKTTDPGATDTSYYNNCNIMMILMKVKIIIIMITTTIIIILIRIIMMMIMIITLTMMMIIIKINQLLPFMSLQQTFNSCT